MELFENKIKELIKLFYWKFYKASFYNNPKNGEGFILEGFGKGIMKAGRYILF